ncbi:MAG: hypothetical protein O3A09_00120 [Bacteroidetes bacterium]|nr:hypothetical protein [Bacteroidota bacterium]
MKKSILALSLAGALIFSSCDSEVVVDDATVQSIVNQAVAAALAQFPDVPSTEAIAAAARQAASEAVAAGFAGQESVDIEAAIAAALNAAEALTNPPVVRIGSGGITYVTSNTEWTNDKIWLMDGKVVVTEGATLSIAEGTIVKAATGYGANATALIIAKDGKIDAVGTAAKPIIFTDVNDQIVYANGTTSPNRSVNERNLWGAVVVLGDDVIGTADGTALIEGLVSGYEFTEYGGTNTAHDGGNLEYVSIRHTGSSLAPGDELQGLTMGGVGSATVVENIELFGSGDDGIEIFGGSVSVTNLLVANQLDDALDFDQAYKGTVSNVVVRMASDSDTVFEIDGSEKDDQTIAGEYTVSGLTAYGRSDLVKLDTFGNWKDSATGLNENVLYVDFPAGTTFGKITDASQNTNGVTYDGEGTSTAAGKLYFNDVVVVTTDAKADILKDTTLESSTWLTVSATRPSTAGADESVFAWTQFYE